ncbi:hypothetical protein SDRG_16790 [Saprolegnia diclina VS20]|uniref:Uncharacterized protein n=1 Tax=Saprolegnia diclina (strain VS20) TaxID=1156394 RepID=T0R756_SAPDV|nr:hypothetical protein SDRG_16790 [Saprolegnia diclina VS20]EQC25327.1 hypothetical protein SDRG_16790 [Saprolegnia diclina VS20]|eukprot:XP_008621232.1 hypothetical protein SDRG_16790 [Saprolegnia diclina VS20]
MADVLLVPDLLRCIVQFQPGLPPETLSLVRHLRRIHLSNYQLTTFLRDDMAPFHDAFPPWLDAHGFRGVEMLLQRKQAYRAHLLYYALIHGHVALLHFLSTRTRVSAKAWALASIYGHQSIAMYLWTHYAAFYDESVSDTAALHGHAGMIELLHKAGAPMPASIRLTAVARGRLSVLQYAHSQQLGEWHPSGVNAAARGGHLDVLRFLHQHNYEGFGPDTMNTATLYGHLHVVRFLHEHRSEGCSPEALVWAAKYGRLPLVTFLDEMRSERDLHRALRAAIKHGHVNVVRYLVRRHLREIDVKAAKAAALRYNQTAVLSVLKTATPGLCVIQ